MMQFSENAPVPLLHPTNGLGLCMDHGASTFLRARPWPGFPTAAKPGLSSAGCMEQLLVRCADAIESGDATLAQQLLWVLNNIAAPDGDPNQRLTSAFLRALIARASRTGGACKALASAVTHADPAVDASLLHAHRLSAVELASFIDLTPWHRFGYAAANAAIVDAVEGFSVVHIVDLSTTHCMQIPTLIDALASRAEAPQLIRLTIPAGPNANSPPPTLDLSYDELGAKLVNFARSRNIGMEFRTVESSPSDGYNSLVEQLQSEPGRLGEALLVNCQMMLHYIPEESINALVGSQLSLRSMFLEAVRGLEPRMVTVVEEDVELTSSDVVGRLRSAFNYMWMAYDAVDAAAAKGSAQRRWYEGGVGWRIENVVAREGAERVERMEGRGRWGRRMRAAGFRAVGFGEEAAAEVKAVVEEHAAGWGMRRDEEELVLTWKGHNVVFATAWLPC